MTKLDILTTAKSLIERYGEEARLYVDSQALDEFISGDKEASENWEMIGEVVRKLLDKQAESFVIATIIGVEVPLIA